MSDDKEASLRVEDQMEMNPTDSLNREEMNSFGGREISTPEGGLTLVQENTPLPPLKTTAQNTLTPEQEQVAPSAQDEMPLNINTSVAPGISPPPDLGSGTSISEADPERSEVDAPSMESEVSSVSSQQPTDQEESRLIGKDADEPGVRDQVANLSEKVADLCGRVADLENSLQANVTPVRQGAGREALPSTDPVKNSPGVPSDTGAALVPTKNEAPKEAQVEVRPTASAPAPVPSPPLDIVALAKEVCQLDQEDFAADQQTLDNDRQEESHWRERGAKLRQGIFAVSEQCRIPLTQSQEERERLTVCFGR